MMKAPMMISFPTVSVPGASQRHILIHLREVLPFSICPCMPGGELECMEQLLEDGYLRRWLRARQWEVEAAASSIMKHAEWRVATMPSGRVSSVRDVISYDDHLI